MAHAMLRQTRWTILLSINAVAILIAGILIASAIWLNGGIEFRVVGERYYRRQCRRDGAP